MQVVAINRVTSEELDTIVGLLGELAAASRKEEGNLSYDFFQDLADPAHLAILECYTRAEDFSAHRESRHFRSIGIEQIIPRLKSRDVQTCAGTSD